VVRYRGFLDHEGFVEIERRRNNTLELAFWLCSCRSIPQAEAIDPANEHLGEADPLDSVGANKRRTLLIAAIIKKCAPGCAYLVAPVSAELSTREPTAEPAQDSEDFTVTPAVTVCNRLAGAIAGRMAPAWDDAHCVKS
jgi:hypothetical protein